MNPDPEIRRLLDVLPASGRMLTKLISKPEQRKVIEAPFPFPWNQERPILINFDLWSQLSRPQRDLMILRTASWLTSIKWFSPKIEQALVAAGLLGAGFEFTQADAIGVLAAGTLATLMGLQIWRKTQSSEVELAADESAIKVALRRGYSESEAAQHLLAAIEAVARIEGRFQLSFVELIRSQNLRAIAGVSPVGMPKSFQ